MLAIGTVLVGAMASRVHASVYTMKRIVTQRSLDLSGPSHIPLSKVELKGLAAYGSGKFGGMVGNSFNIDMGKVFHGPSLMLTGPYVVVLDNHPGGRDSVVTFSQESGLEKLTVPAPKIRDPLAEVMKDITKLAPPAGTNYWRFDGQELVTAGSRSKNSITVEKHMVNDLAKIPLYRYTARNVDESPLGGPGVLVDIIQGGGEKWSIALKTPQTATGKLPRMVELKEDKWVTAKNQQGIADFINGVTQDFMPGVLHLTALLPSIQLMGSLPESASSKKTKPTGGKGER